MMMALGFFIFSIHTSAYQSLEKNSTWNHPSNSRVGRRDGFQYTGPGDETITLNGWFSPQVKGSAFSLDFLEEMANTGKAYVLISGTGRVYGSYVIESLKQTHEYFYKNGRSRRIEFSLQLKKIDESLFNKMIGDLKLPDIKGLV
ncbi:hypothetical protein AAEX37_01003 [Oligella sp. MSHR50489EDL]|uniref:phage tail protein n=1 Tax=Oligella sp. MSHR50489EDL TaxID=3139409 RepID=UPI003D81745A